MSTWNKKNFSIYTSDERSALGLIEELGNQTNYNTDEVKKLGETKTDLTGDHKGTWQGLKPLETDIGVSIVLTDVVDNVIPSLKEEVGKKVDESNVVLKGKGTLDDFNEETRAMLQGLKDGEINAVLGKKNVNTININDGAVTPFQTNFLFENVKNILKYVNFTSGKAISHLDGTEISGVISGEDYYSVSDFISVEPMTTYRLHVNFNIAFYNINKEFISGMQGSWGDGTNIFSTPSGCYYIRITVHADKSVNRIMTKGTQLVEKSDYSFVTDLAESINQNIKDKVNSKGYVYLDSIEPFTVSTNNLFHHIETFKHSYINPLNGKMVTVSDESSGHYKYNCSDYIEVESNKNYVAFENHNLAFYDENYDLISGTYGGWKNPITTPVNAKYIRISFIDNENKYFGKGDTLPIEEERKIKINYSNKQWEYAFNKLINNISSKLNGITWNVLGDSITSTNYSRPNWWEIIKDKYNMVVNNYGISGTTLAHTDDRHLWDYDFGKLDSSTIGYNPEDPSTWSTGNCMCERFSKMSDDADLITVMGSTNDGSVKLGTWESTDTSTFYGALNVLIQGLINKYPNKKIAFFTPIQSANCYLTNVANASAELDKKSATDTLSLQLRAEAIKRKCRQYSIPCLDLFNESGINGVGGRKTENYRTDDNLHPSVTGNKNMSIVIENFILSLF